MLCGPRDSPEATDSKAVNLRWVCPGDALRGFLDGLSGDVGGQQRKQREAEAEAQATEYLVSQVKTYLRHFVEGAQKLDALGQVLVSMGVMHLIQNAPLDIAALQSHQIDQLQQYAETLVEERRQGRSVLLDNETRWHGERHGQSGQQL